jgi:tRNA modification GTPase
MASLSPRYGDEDCIAALATPPGKAALAVIRLSGRGCVEKLAPLFSRPEKLLKAKAYTLHYGSLGHIDDVITAVYRAPHSYSGEESAEISCHGGYAIVNALMAALKSAGFREALPGEFSFRAFRNGKMDLSEAEAVMEMVEAQSEKGREHAYSRLSGSLEKEIDDIKSALSSALAELEMALDYPAGETEAGDDEHIKGHIREASQKALPRLEALAQSYKREQLYKEGALVVIAGRPNAGKSSLFNRLLKEERSLVTPVSGTTRDWIEARLVIGDIPLRLADTAGLKSGAGLPEAPASESGIASQAEIERLGIEQSRRLIAGADLVLYLIDAEQGEDAEDREFISKARSQGLNLIVAGNKADLKEKRERKPGADHRDSVDISLSALTGQGIEELCRAIVKSLEEAVGPTLPESSALSSTGIGTERQKELVEVALGDIRETMAALEAGVTADMVAESLHAAVNALGEITGEVTTADLLETMFSQFCVGK